MKAPVSVCMIVRDEAENLPACLETVLPICEEVIVVDTGSRDGTPEIATSLGAHVASFPWIDDFSAARNFAAAQARQPFILRLDADERLAEGSLHALLDYCSAQPRVAGRATMTNLLGDGETTSESLTCLYPNLPGYAYERRIHEQLRFSGEAPATIPTAVVILHTGYAPAVIEARAKGERNLRLLERELTLAPNDPYVHYQIGRTHYALKNYAAATERFQAALSLLDGEGADNVPYASMILLQQAYAYMYLGDLESAVRTIALGVELFPTYTDLYFVYGLALMQLGGPTHVGDMVAAFEHCLVLGEADSTRYSTVAGVGSYRAHHNLGAFREALGDTAGAAEHYRQAAAAGFQPSLQRLQSVSATRRVA